MQENKYIFGINRDKNILQNYGNSIKLKTVMEFWSNETEDEDEDD